MKIMVIISSVRKTRAADTVAPWVRKQLEQYEDIELDVADLREIPLPLFNADVHPAVANGFYEGNPEGTAWAQRVADADGFIFIVAEYNHGYTAALKNAIDWVAQGWYGKPAAFVSYGGISGGTRAVQQLKQVLLEVRMVPVHDAVYIPFVRQAFNEDGTPVNESLTGSFQALMTELTGWVRRLRPAADKQASSVA
jgi:NAD(P)H-dependent FMN reductase